MFRLTKAEFDSLLFQFGIASWGGTRSLPYAFTEQVYNSFAQALS